MFYLDVEISEVDGDLACTRGLLNKRRVWVWVGIISTVVRLVCCLSADTVPRKPLVSKPLASALGMGAYFNIGMFKRRPAKRSPLADRYSTMRS